MHRSRSGQPPVPAKGAAPAGEVKLVQNATGCETKDAPSGTEFAGYASRAWRHHSTPYGVPLDSSDEVFLAAGDGLPSAGNAPSTPPEPGCVLSSRLRADVCPRLASDPERYQAPAV